MQLTCRGSIGVALASATASLLSATPANAVDKAQNWQIVSAFYVYSEKDRVNVVEPVAQAKREIADDEFVTVTLVADAMTGASPNGASPAAKPQTFTAASGNVSYSTPANTLPVHTFEDLRGAVAVDWDKPLSRLSRVLVGGSFSQEFDYTSMGASATYSRDSEDKFTTFSLGAALGLDFVQAKGGAPEPFSLLGNGATRTSRDDDDDEGNADIKNKTIVDVVAGVTQVMTPRWLTQFNIGLGLTQGYLSDPYKMISLIDPANGDTFNYRAEKRPDSRFRQTFYTKTAYHFSKDTAHVSYRYYADNWGLRAHTADLKYRLELGARHYLQPHLRYYHQDEANFFRHNLVGLTLPTDNASADLRLATMSSYILGLKFGFPLGKRHELSARVEHMRQQGESHPNSAIGSQKSQDFFPKLRVWMAQIGYSFEF